MPFLLIDFPSLQSDRGRDRTVRDPLVRARPISAASSFGWLYARSLLKNERLWGGPAPISLLQIDDFILWVTLGIILGGRTGYVLFYNLPFFIEHPAAIFQLWEGGMSFHGGFLGCVVAVMWFAQRTASRSCRSVTSPPRSLRRSGSSWCGSPNFINGELWGRASRCERALGHDFSDRRCTCRAIRASSMKPAWRASCCSSCSR